MAWRNTDSRPHDPRLCRRALTLVEALTALTVISILLAASVPTVVRTTEQAHADVAGANLNAIWNAQRFHWLENRVYATDLSTLADSELLDRAVIAGTRRYRYTIVAADASTFSAAATRIGSGVWSGQYSIDESGAVWGTVQKPGAGYVITPSLD